MHRTTFAFWANFDRLPSRVQSSARRNYKLLVDDPRHPSLHFKPVRGRENLWSVRIGIHYRALAERRPYGYLWFWIGSHAEYDGILR